MEKHPDWPSLRAKPTDLMKPGTVVSTMWSFSDPLRAVHCSTQKPARMTVQPARVDLLGTRPQPLAQPTGQEFSRQVNNPFSPATFNAQRRLSWGVQLLSTCVGALLLFAVFGEDAANQVNRRDLRLNNAQMIDVLILLRHLSSPLPWESAHFNPAQNPAS